MASQETQGTRSSSPSVEEPPLWGYVSKVEKQGAGGTWQFKCNLCDDVRQGSYSRVKTHLLGIKGHRASFGKENTKLNSKRKRKEESKSKEPKKSRREHDDDDHDKVVKDGHRHTMSLYDLSVELMKLHKKGEREKALELAKDTKVCEDDQKETKGCEDDDLLFQQETNVCEDDDEVCCDYRLQKRKRPLHHVVANGRFTSLMLPHVQPVVPGHCYIMPMQHILAARSLDDPAWEEIRRFKQSIVLMFASRTKRVLFLETVTGLADRRRHCVIECIPLCPEDAKRAISCFEQKFMEINQADEELNVKKLIDTSQKETGLRVFNPIPYHIPIP